MIEFLTKTISNRDHLLKYALVLLTIFLISMLFPNNVRFKYDYQVGKLWNHGDLVAPFDFAILKPHALLEEEAARTARTLGNYYTKDTNIQVIAISDFKEDLNKILQSLDRGEYADLLDHPQKYMEMGTSLLDHFHTIGIVTQDTFDRATPVKVVAENVVTTAAPLPREEVLSKMRARLQLSGLLHASLLYPILERHISPNMVFSEELTAKFLQRALQKVPKTKGMVSQGDLIVAQGATISEESGRILDSFREAYESKISANRSYWIVFVGYLLLTCLIIGVYLFYLQFHNRKVFKSWRKLLFMLMWLPLYGYLVHIVEDNGTLSTYMIPFCIAPIVIKTFYNDRLALFSLIVIVLIASFLSSLGYEFTFLQILAGIVTVLSNHVTRYWSKFFNSILLILLTYCLGYLGLTLVVEGDLATIDWSMYIWFFVNVILTLLAYPLVPLIERIFGFTSSITLSELSDVNRPLLKELSMKAPGTFQHSLQVGNLAEAAAEAIGADSFLVKVAALYHDIGKMEEPEIFIENQGSFNPHDDLTAEESAQKIIRHVIYGAALAKKHRLPKVLIDLIWTHHGTTRVEYFYQTAKEDKTLTAENESQFQYPGPKPTTQEQAILMLADSIEAASKSLKEPTESSLNTLVDKIISFKIDRDQMQLAEISFRDLEKIRHSFKQVLKSINHIRVEYPEAAEDQV